MTPLRVVTPFRPFQAESLEHQELGPFDWHGAIEMLRESVRRSCDCETVGLTDVDTELPGATFHLPTRERRYLMLWILEVSRAYLESEYFDRDTVFCSPDMLIFGDLRPWMVADFGIVVRPEHERPILNAVQWWPVASRQKLIALYRKAEKIARRLPEPMLIWGADSEPFRILLEPIASGLGFRKRTGGLFVNQIHAREVLTPLSSAMSAALEQDAAEWPSVPIVDFRVTRKHHMRRYFDATLGKAVAA